MTKKARVTIEGADALTITEARVLIIAAMAGRRTAVSSGDVYKVLDACAKVAEGLIMAGQDRESVAKLLEG